jgi:hypothetical protein
MKRWYFAIPLILSAGLVYQNCGQPRSEQALVQSQSMSHYYFVQSGYTCSTMSGNTVSSYKDHVAIEGTRFLIYGDMCNDAVQEYDVTTTQFTLSSDGQTLTYQGNTYQLMDSPPL